MGKRNFSSHFHIGEKLGGGFTRKIYSRGTAVGRATAWCAEGPGFESMHKQLSSVTSDYVAQLLGAL